MTQEVKNNEAGAGFHPAVAMRAIPEPEASQPEGVVIVSAYALALRDPGLFSACYGPSQKQLH